MSKFVFGSTSKERLETCHFELRLIAMEALAVSMIDFGIAVGHRPVKIQQHLYGSGRDYPGPILTNIDGLKKKGKHNYTPSLAFDIYAWVNGKASWSERDLCYLGGVITATAERLLNEGKIQSRLRWGGNWDGDGEIITDQGFLDLPHFELI